MKRLVLMLMFVTISLNILVSQNTEKETILFDSDKYEITNDSKNKLDLIIEKIKLSEIKSIEIKGYTDNVGAEKENDELSKKRAMAVFEYLNSKNIKNIETEYFGEKQPVATNDNESGKQLNRRVEIVFTYNPKIVKNIFLEFDKETQHYKQNSNKDIEIKGKEGTIINISANSFVKVTGETVTGDVDITLKEYYLKSDIVIANLHTMSDGKLLETGGMIYIEVKKNGEKLELKTGNEITISFKGSKDTTGMELFTGNVKNDNINWVKEAKTKITGIRYEIPIKRREIITFTIEGEIVDTAEYKKQNVFDGIILKSGSLGWINCDRFYKIKNKTNLIVASDSLYKPIIRLVFKDINSIMSGWRNSKDNKIYFEEIPVGMNATLIGFSMVNDQVYFASKDIIIGKNQQENIELLQTTLEALENDLKKLN